MSGRVIVVGSVNIDLVARVSHLPHPGETVTGGTYERHHGGKGGNQAVAAARLRRPTLFIGAVGDDTFEKEVRRALTMERVDVSMVAVLPGQPTGMALILVDATGENEIAVVPGANGAIETGYVRDCLARLGPLNGDVMLVCNEVSLHVVREALMCGHAAGAITVLNPAPATGIDRSIFGLADIVTPNRTELATLLQAEAMRTGRRLDSTATDAAVRARSLLELGPEGPGVRKAVIVTLGAAGVVVLERVGSGLDGTVAGRLLGPDPNAGCGDGEAAADAQAAGPREPVVDVFPAPAFSDVPMPEPVAAHVAAPARVSAPEPAAGSIKTWEVPADQVATVDSTGAGDAFCGALAAALAEGRPLAEAVRRAVAGSALATTHSGAREGMPTAAELEEFLAARTGE
ncbi:MAG TPA: ribokinase [Candidatus Limnocylindrales bacterium]